MTDVLVLGGTGWLSGRIAERWADAGAAVTCLARGGREAPYGTTLVVADRDDPGAYDAVDGRDWDEVVDISSNPVHVAAAVTALGERAKHWTYISTVSVYAANDVPGADETAELLAPAGPDEEDDYGQAKVRAEASVRAALGFRAAIVRPGLIVGPGDPTDRFGYWVGRLALAADGDVLVPDTTDRGAQVIDVDDLAAFVQAIGRERWTGVVNAVGDPIELAEVLRLAREVAGHTGALVPGVRRVARSARRVVLGRPAVAPALAARRHAGLLDPLEHGVPAAGRQAAAAARDARAHPRRRAHARPGSRPPRGARAVG